MKTKSFRLLPFLLAIVMAFMAIGPSALAASELGTFSDPFSDEQKEENLIGSLISDSDDRLDKPDEHDHEHTRGTSADEQTIWNYLYNKLGNAYGAAGMMGNLYAESDLRSNNLQNSYEGSLGYSDSSYTAAVDNGNYTNFVNDSAGYGLAQWTYYTRKQAMLIFARSKEKSIGDLNMQLDFLWSELTQSYGSLVNTLRNATSVFTASTAVLTQFERPAGMNSSSVQNTRAAYAQTFFDRYSASDAATPSGIGAGTTYNYTAAAQYGYNHAYDTPTYSGGDCANFTSHCLAAGGVTVINSSTYYSANTQSYNNCSGTLGAYRNPYIASAAQLLYLSEFYEVIASPSFSQIELGDIVFMRRASGSSPDTHVVIITGFNGSQPLYSGHTTARQNHPLGSGVATFVVKMRRPHGGSSNPEFTSDSKYASFRGFKAYPCATSNFVCYNRDLTTSPGKIYTTDYCTINDVYTNGWCEVSCPWNGGGYKTVYTQISNFIKTPSESLGSFTASEYINLYSTYSLGTQIFRIYPGDVCYTIGSYNGATQVFMPHNGGYYVLGWISGGTPSAPSNPDVDGAYPTPFNCKIISSTKVRAYNSIGGSSPGYVYPEDDCVIREVYTSGWCKIECPWMDGTTKTLYIGIEEFVHFPRLSIYGMTAPKYATTYYKSNGASSVGWIDPGDSIHVLSEENGMTQIVYPANTSTGKRCAWVYTSELVTQYTVSYNANGGTNAPAAQIKYSNADLTLSYDWPSRTGYKFMGWGTSAGATTPSYYAGSIYSTNANITLYAIWTPNVYTVSFLDWDGAVLKTQTVNHGSAATAPTPPNHVGYTFAGWDRAFNSVTSDITVTALYNINTYTVTFKDWDGTVLKTQTVEYGSDATAPANPTRPGYTFIGWDRAFDNVTSDLMVTALYQQNTPEPTATPTVAPTAAPITPSPDEPQIVVSSKTVTAGSTVTVDVSLLNNPGIVSMALTVDFDERLELVSVSDSGLIPGQVHSPTMGNPYVLCWVNDTATENFTANGAIATLTFEIPEDMPVGEYPITVSYDLENYDIYNCDVELVEFAIVNGRVNVIDVLIGDVNTDTKVNALDRLYLTRFLAKWADYPEAVINMIAADVNVDTKVNALDRLILTRHLAKWAGYENLPYTAKSAPEAKKVEIKGGDPTIVVDTVTAEPGETVTVQVGLENNPGIVSMTLTVDFDEALELIGRTDTGLLPGQVHSPTLGNPYTLCWVNDTATTNYTVNGAIVELTLRLSENAAPGEYPITISYDLDNYDIYNCDVEPVEFAVVNGGVTYEEPQPTTYTVTFTVNGEYYTSFELEAGEAVTAPEYEAPEGHTFSGWNVPDTMPAEDITLDATLTVNSYTVTFVDSVSGDIIAEVLVNHGETAPAPEAPVHMWFTFTGWDKDFSEVTEDMTVTAQYEEKGDVNGDGAVSIEDAIALMRYLLKINIDTVLDESSVDFNSDSEVNLIDALVLMRHVLGIIN